VFCDLDLARAAGPFVFGEQSVRPNTYTQTRVGGITKHKAERVRRSTMISISAPRAEQSQRKDSLPRAASSGQAGEAEHAEQKKAESQRYEII